MHAFTDRLRGAAASEDRAERTLRLAAVISEVLSAAGGRPVLVGGGAVEIYTRSAYTTRDLDFVAAVTDEVIEAMLELGFERDGRHWVASEIGLVVEFPATALEPAVSTSLDVDGHELCIIAVEDLIVDRLASWKHWGWDPDGAAAVILLAIHDDLDKERLRERASEEDVMDALTVLGPLAESGRPVTDQGLQELRARMIDGGTR